MAIEGIICNQNQSRAIPSSSSNNSCALAAKAVETAIYSNKNPHSIELENNGNFHVSNNSKQTLSESLNVTAKRHNSVACHPESYEFSGKKIRIRNGNYEYDEVVENLIGYGSYGTVFSGTDFRLTRRHSIYNNTTVQPLNLSDSTDLPSTSTESDGVRESRKVALKKVARLSLKSNELRAMKRVRHPNLVRLIDICDADVENEDQKEKNENCTETKVSTTFTYLIMELCEGDLENHLQKFTKNGCLMEQDMHKVIESIACGYLALYEKQIVHRDIKPQNILLTYNKKKSSDAQVGQILTAKITDFGISRIMTSSVVVMNGECNEEASGGYAETSEVLNNLAGTFYYMAPEVGANILRISEYDHSADMWSIGCVIFQCLTGSIPFDEPMLCRLFLYCACENYDAYDLPDFPENTMSEQWKSVIETLLQINSRLRATPKEFYSSVVLKQNSAKLAPVSAFPANLSSASLSSDLSSTTLENSSADEEANKNS